MFSLIHTPAASSPNEDRKAFGYGVLGPILADMLQQLHTHLQALRGPQAPVVFFCSRGGLTLRRSLDLFVNRVGLDLQVRCEDFMVSRLTAFRTAFQLNPIAIAPLIEIEFEGSTCAQAVHALWNLNSDGETTFNDPFSVSRLIQISRNGELGRHIRSINNEQSALLRHYIDTLRDTNRRVVLCDTGIFGSILRYLQLGVPAVDWRLILLFRANYKRIHSPHFEFTAGVVSESDVYLPWRPRTAVLLYWQLIEAMLEPPLPSVRYYSSGPTGRVVSDLEFPAWQGQLDIPAGSLLAGANSYIRDLTPESLPLIRGRAQRAWNQLRRMIVFPSRKDVAMLEVGRRSLDFGTTETVQFTSDLDRPRRRFRGKLSIAADSMWPEGELRKQFPHTAGPFLLGMELSRWVRALNHM